MKGLTMSELAAHHGARPGGRSRHASGTTGDLRPGDQVLVPRGLRGRVSGFVAAERKFVNGAVRIMRPPRVLVWIEAERQERQYERWELQRA